MDVLTSLNENSRYSTTDLQLIIAAWVLSKAIEPKAKISLDNGDIPEGSYRKQSIYSLLYSLYTSIGVARGSDAPFEFTFNTWGYAWPDGWGPAPTHGRDPERFGINAYSGLYAFPQLTEYVAERKGHVHVVELGCGTGAGASLTCRQTLPSCTYEAIDMQAAAIDTCRRKFVPGLEGRLTATCGDVTKVRLAPESADIVAICETHVTEQVGRVTTEDKRFFDTAHRTLKPGGHITWGNAIPDSTWQPCFEYLESIGMKRVDVRDVTKRAVDARDEDRARVDAYVNECLDRFYAFRIPVLGAKRRTEARIAMENFYRNPGTNLYANMTDGTDTYKVALFEKTR